MTNIKINHKNATIEMNKTTAKATSVFGTEEYNDLISVKNSFPTYRIVIVSIKRASDGFKGMDYEFMMNYIKTHENAEERGAQFDKLRDEKLTYGEIKKWFLDKYPVFKDCRTRAEWILAA